MDAARPPRWLRRSPRSRTISATALALLFAATACSSSGSGTRGPGAGGSSTTTSSTTSTTMFGCEPPGANGIYGCVVDGRPLRRRRRLLLPVGDGFIGDDDARSEYASVASFGELALRLIAVGAPVELVEACHRAALEEIGHARTADALARRSRSRFGAIPELLGRRIGGRSRSRRAQLQALAVESFVDGWRNEGAAANRLRLRAAAAASPGEQAALLTMADEEQGHAELAKRIVEWCFAEDPAAVGAALGRVVEAPAA